MASVAKKKVFMFAFYKFLDGRKQWAINILQPCNVIVYSCFIYFV